MKGSIRAVAIAALVLALVAVLVSVVVAALNANFGWAVVGIFGSLAILGAAIAGYDG